MANLTTSSDIDTFMGSANNAAARTNLGVLPLAGGTLTGQLIQSTNGAASTPSLLLNGTIFTGGSATTTKPAHLIEPTGTTSTGWSTLGTAYGANMPTGFTGNYFDGQINGVSKVKLGVINGGPGMYLGAFDFQGDFGGSGRMKMGGINGFYFEGGSYMALGSTTFLGWAPGATGAGNTVTDLRLVYGGTAILQMGSDAAGVTNQHFKACNRITSNGVGANLTISGGNGRGGAGGSLILATYDTGASATPGTLLTRLTLDTAGVLTFANGVNMSLASTMIGAANTDALAFWGTSPVTQPAHIADPTGDSGTGLDTVDKTVLDTTLTDIQASIASINAMLAITGLTAAI